MSALSNWYINLFSFDLYNISLSFTEIVAYPFSSTFPSSILLLSSLSFLYLNSIDDVPLFLVFIISIFLFISYLFPFISPGVVLFAPSFIIRFASPFNISSCVTLNTSGSTNFIVASFPSVKL